MQMPPVGDSSTPVTMGTPQAAPKLDLKELTMALMHKEEETAKGDLNKRPFAQGVVDSKIDEAIKGLFEKVSTIQNADQRKQALGTIATHLNKAGERDRATTFHLMDLAREMIQKKSEELKKEGEQKGDAANYVETEMKSAWEVIRADPKGETDALYNLFSKYNLKGSMNAVKSLYPLLIDSSSVCLARLAKDFIEKGKIDEGVKFAHSLSKIDVHSNLLVKLALAILPKDYSHAIDIVKSIRGEHEYRFYAIKSVIKQLLQNDPDKLKAVAALMGEIQYKYFPSQEMLALDDKHFQLLVDSILDKKPPKFYELAQVCAARGSYDLVIRSLQIGGKEGCDDLLASADKAAQNGKLDCMTRLIQRAKSVGTDNVEDFNSLLRTIAKTLAKQPNVTMDQYMQVITEISSEELRKKTLSECDSLLNKKAKTLASEGAMNECRQLITKISSEKLRKETKAECEKIYNMRP